MKIKLSELKKIIEEESQVLEEGEANSSGEDLEEQMKEMYGKLNRELYAKLDAFMQNKLVGHRVEFNGGEYARDTQTYDGIVTDVDVFRQYDDPLAVSITLDEGTMVPHVSMRTLEIIEDMEMWQPPPKDE